MKRILYTAVFLISLTELAFSQKVEFTASAPNVVAINEQFRLIYTVNQEGNNFRAADIKDFTILQGPSTSSNSSIQIINGQVSKQVSYTYTFFLRPVKEGKFSIGPAQIQVNGKTYTSNSLSIEVVKASSSSGQQGQVKGNQLQQQQSQGSGATDANVGDKEFYVTVELSKTNVYQGEHIVATIKIFTQLGLAGFEDMKFPTYDGFWTQDIETPQNVNLQRANVNGQIYNMGIMKKSILFPQRSGELTIDPFELTAIVQKQVQRKSRSIWDNFFGGGVQNVKVKVKSRPVKVNVKPLPANKPADFKGAVGNMKMTASIDKTNVKTNDAISLKIRVTGNGNLKLIDPLEIQFPPDFEVYDPKISADVRTGSTGMEGSKTFEYLMIPRHAGDYTIPPFSFSSFDLSSKQFRTETSPQFNIHVEKGNEDESTTVISGFSKEDVKFIGKDIRYIKTGQIKLIPKNRVFFGSVLFWILYIAPFILFILIVVLYRKKLKENQNTVLIKNKKANKIARKRLKTASGFMKQGNKQKFYEEILKAIMGYLSDKLSIPVAELSKDNVLERLGKYKLDSVFTDKFIILLNNCEYAQYAPPGESTEMESIYNEAISIISEFEQRIR